MKKLFFLLLILSLLFTYSCQDDVIGESNVDEVISVDPTVTTTLSTGIYGIVVDEAGNALPNVDIEYSRQNYETDENGYFEIEDVKAPENGGLLYFDKPGYFRNFKFFIPELNTKSYLKVQMVDRGNPSTFSTSDTIKTIQSNGGSQVIFDPSGFAYDADNTPYEGEVTVYTHWYNPQDINLNEAMPGDLRALSTEGDIVQLSTYGMMAVEIYAANGDELNLAEGVKATMRFKVPDVMKGAAPSSIKTWSLNEETAYWEEESTAELSGDFYVTEVEHFSFWNCDAPYPLVNISGKLVDKDGNPLPHYSLCIEAPGRSMTGYGWTDSNGGFRGKVPKNEDLILKIKDDCGNVVLEQAFGPLSGETTLGEITVETAGQINISGQLVCDGEVVSNGYVQIFTDGRIYDVAETDENGFFSSSIISCDNFDLKLIAIDRDNSTTSKPVTVNTAGQSNFDFGTIQVCNDADEYIRWKVDGGPESIVVSPIDSLGFNNSLQLIGILSNNEVIQLQLLNPQLGGGQNLLSFFLIDNNLPNGIECGSCLDVNITELGDYIVGTVMGDINGTNIMVSFRVKIDFTLPMICEVDTQNPSACDANDAVVNVQISNGTPPYQFFLVNTANQDTENISGDDPSAVFENLAPGFYVMEAVDGAGNECRREIRILSDSNLECELDSTPSSCAGNDGSITALVFNGSGDYEYEWSNGETGETIEDLASGGYVVTITDTQTGCTTLCELFLWQNDSLFVDIINPNNLICDPSQASLIAEMFGGVPPYTYEWNTGETTQEITNLQEGVYSVIVTDANGCAAENVFELRYNNQNVEIGFEQVQTGCDPAGFPTGYIEVLTIDLPNPVLIEWSNGETGSILNNPVFEEDYLVTITDDNGCQTIEQVSFFPQTWRSIRGFAWYENENSPRPDNYDMNFDTLASGIEVSLYDNMDPANPLQVTETNFRGFYSFSNVEAGNYFVRFGTFGAPAFEFVEQNEGNDDATDSDVNPGGDTESIITDGCNPVLDVSAGIKL